MKENLEKQLIGILSRHPWFMTAMDTVAALGLSEWCIGAGVIRNIVFDHMNSTGVRPRTAQGSDLRI
jgi:hypothetical protein